MRVWLITVGEPLALFGDRPLRTGMLANALRTRGHEVSWWTSDMDHYRRARFEVEKPVVQTHEGVEIRFLQGMSYRRSISIKRWVNHVQIARAFARDARRADRPDVILSSLPTLELCRAAVEYGRANSVPVVIDIRDLWPDEFHKLMPSWLRPVGHVLLGRLESHARYALASADGITATSRRYLEWALEKADRAQRPQDEVFTHGYPDVEVSQQDRQAMIRQLEEVGVRPSARVFWFVGSLGGSIDLATVIDAARRLTQVRELQFVISGTGPDEKRWRRETAELSNVVWTGWVDQTGIDAMSSIAVAGLAPYRKGALMGLPNKIFEYMKFGLPVVIGLHGEATELIHSSETGLSYVPGDAESLAAAVRRLAFDPELQLRLGKNAKATFVREFVSDVVYARMAGFLETMVESPVAYK